MIARSLLTLASTVALALHASAQFVVSTNKTSYEPKEPIVVGEKFVNTSMIPIPYATTNPDETTATILYELRMVDLENQATTTPAFDVERNGSVTLKVRFMQFHCVSSGFNGEIGPGRSSTMGGTLGFGVPLNLLLAPPATTGVSVDLITDTNQVVTLAPGDRIAILSPGVFRLTALVNRIQINGYSYSSSTNGFLVAETFFDIERRKHAAAVASAASAAPTR